MAQNARRRTPHVDVLSLTTEKDTREALAYFRHEEQITINPEDRFAIVPGPKGHGWSLQIQRGDPDDD